ncbi:MAG: alpha/beta hydrolase [Actinomycetota bacterium]|nr:alpha/beta hydrolase [Actinomycetota bacterium]
MFEVPGAVLYVEVDGAGPPLLSVSGSGAALHERVLTLPPELTERFTVAAYDHRGLGRSTCEDAPLSMGDFAADGFAVADALGWTGFAVLGTSFGGMVALEMAVSQPERVTRLALCCTSSGGAGGSSFPLHERPDPLEWLALMDSRAQPRAALAAMFGGRQPPREPGYERQLQARRTHDVWERLPRVTAPTLVAAGAYDGIAPLANSAAIASRIPGARLEVFEGGHAFLHQDARAWPVVCSFLSDADPTEGPLA